MKLFLPCSSKNFSLIFETEGVSPKLFYNLREFGNIRFKASPLDISDNYLTLYDKPYSFTFSERENFPMWLEFETEKLSSLLTDLSKFHDSIEPNIAYLYPKTIYFDTATFRCIFADAKQLRDTKIDSESYRNVKTTAKYKINVEDLDFFKKPINLPVIQVMPNPMLRSEVEKDKRFNNFKGFLYGYSIGKLRESTPEKDRLISLLSEIQSSFTNAKSQIIIQGSEKESRYPSFNDKFSEKKFKSLKSKVYYQPPTYSLSDSKTEIIELIAKAEHEFNCLFPNNEMHEMDVLLLKGKKVLVGLQQENADPTLIEECQEFLKSLSIRNNLFALMRNATEGFFRIAVTKAGLLAAETEKKERSFKTSLKKVERKVEQSFLNRPHQPKGLNLDEFVFVNSFQIEIDRTLMKLSEENEYALFEIIASYILYHPRPKKQGEISRDEKAEIIRNIGSTKRFQTELGSKNNQSHYYKNLRDLYDHFDKFSDLRYEAITSNVLQNFACFLSKIERLDELMEITEIKNIKNRQISYAFWSGYNGFSEISTRNSKIIFASEDLALINSFENFLQNVLRKLDSEIFDDTIKELQEEEGEKPIIFSVSPGERQEEVSNFPQITSENSILNEVQEESATYKVWTGNTFNFPEKEPQMETMHEDNAARSNQLLSKLQSSIWKTALIGSLNDKQKDDISTAIIKTKEIVGFFVSKGTEIYNDKRHILSAFRTKLTEVNGKRKKAQYKITTDVLETLFIEINQGIDKEEQ